MVGVEVHRARALTCAELVGIGEGVLQQLHDRNHAAGLVLDVLDRGAELAQVAQQQGHATAALGELEGRVDAARNRLHVVFDAHQEAADRFATLGLAEVQEGRGGGLEAAVQDLVHKVLSKLLVTIGQAERDHAHAIFEALEVAATVKGLQGVGRVVLVRTQERLEAELLGVCPLKQGLHKREVVLLEHGRIIVVIVD